MEMTLTLDLLKPVDWRVLRAVRLEALLDSPDAYTSSYAREVSWSELEWRRALRTARWIVARQTEKVIGLAKSVREHGRPTTRHVESVWVSPLHRRQGVFRALMHALSEIERCSGVTDLLLWVLEDNQGAQLAYEALGFEPTGERQPLPDLGRFERRLSVGLRH
jgi:ribosomal protein S18 acetylase RimI-like enzyme